MLHPVSRTRLRIYSHYHASKNLFLIRVFFHICISLYIYIILYIYIFPSHHTVIYLKSSTKAIKISAFPKEFEDVFCHAAAHMEREWDHFENCLDARCKQLWHHHLHETFESKQICYSTSLTWFISMSVSFIIWKFRKLPLRAVNSDSNHWQPRG